MKLDFFLILFLFDFLICKNFFLIISINLKKNINNLFFELIFHDITKY